MIDTPTHKTLPKVGIVVPIYNVEAYLKECLNSIRNQSYECFEVALIDDGSTDSSAFIAQEYAANDNRFVFLEKQNGGLSSARNAGIDYFKNRAGGGVDDKIAWICFLDSDDFWDKDFLKNCLECSKSECVQIVWCDYEMYFDGIDYRTSHTIQDGYPWADSRLISSRQWLEESVRIGSFYWAWSGIIDFEFLCEKNVYFLDKVLHEDHNFGALLFTQADFIFMLKQKLYKYRIRPNSITNVNATTKPPTYLANIYKAFNNPLVAREYYRCASLFLQLLELDSFRKRQDKETQKYLKKLIQGTYFDFSRNILRFKHDPLHLFPKLTILEEYIDSRKRRVAFKLYCACPFLYRARCELQEFKTKLRQYIKATFFATISKD